MKTLEELDQDVSALAEILIARFGVRAPSYAVLQALKARCRGQQRTMEIWHRIADAIPNILRTDPNWATPAKRPDSPFTVSRAPPPPHWERYRGEAKPQEPAREKRGELV